MTERKFTDEKIIKALELCIQNTFCESCEYREKTDKSDICPIRMDALNLINKQNAEIETLKDNNEHLAVILEETKAEVEKLQNELVIWKQNRFNLFQRLECYETARQKVASEIFAEIESLIDGKFSINHGVVLMSKEDFAELKKKTRRANNEDAKMDGQAILRIR